MNLAERTAALKAQARRLGFDLVGACPAVQPEGVHRFLTWLESGYAGQMQYFAARRDAYLHPSGVLPATRSLLLLGLNYRTAEPQPAGGGQGRVSRYAWGRDYHDLIHGRLNALAEWLRGVVPGAAVRGVVDSAPLLEREFAQLAGLGWIGKNTLLLNKDCGSWFFLAALLTDVELEYDAPYEADHCGTCRACLDACPTQAFPAPYQLDARRCISYLTIELREPLPAALRESLGDWVFGCDVCQEVCPWNRRPRRGEEPELEPAEGMNPLSLAPLFWLADEEFRRRFRHTPLWRAKRRGLLRNAAIVLGNQPGHESLAALAKGLDDAEPLVRGACAWALGRLRSVEADVALRRRLQNEEVPAVRAEILTALADVERV